MSVAFFVSPHGFGHAARAAAIMAALRQLRPRLRFEVFTTVPVWFFADTLASGYRLHQVTTDVGMVQATSLTEDLPATLDALDRFLPFDAASVQKLARRLQALGCALVVCDISPLGLAAAAGLPSVLVENFTWDWVYDGYLPHLAARTDRERLQRAIAYLRDAFAQAPYRIQAEPVCQPACAHLRCSPISRAARTPPDVVRSQLGIAADDRLVTITLGGTPWNFDTLAGLEEMAGVRFLIPGGSSQVERRGSVLLIPHRSRWFHPDLIAASDAVIAKLGYSTLAEVYHAGAPFGYVLRPQFRESAVMQVFAQAHMPGFAIDGEAFAAAFGPERQGAQREDGEQRPAWLEEISSLLALPRMARQDENGAGQVAAFLDSLLPPA